MRLIDADALLKASRRGKVLYFDDTTTNGYTDVLLAVEVEHAPTIEAESVRHGKWIRSGGDKYPIYTCSECDYDSNAEMPYCANCGAEMDGGEENE